MPMTSIYDESFLFGIPKFDESLKLFPNDAPSALFEGLEIQHEDYILHEDTAQVLKDYDVHFLPIQSPEPTDTTLISPSPEPFDAQEPDAQDEDDATIWLGEDIQGPNVDQNQYSWERFLDPRYGEIRPAFISEAGPRAFDAVLQGDAGKGKRGGATALVLQQGFVIKCLAEAGLGRSSALYSYNEEEEKFVRTRDGTRPSGYSLKATQSVERRVLWCGTSLRILRAFVDDTSVRSCDRGLIAYAEAVSAILLAIEDCVGSKQRSVETLLQLDNIFSMPHKILELLRDLAPKIKDARSKIELVTRLFDKLADLDGLTDGLDTVMAEVFKRAATPWIHSIEQVIGLRKRAHGIQPDEALEAVFGADSALLPGNDLSETAQYSHELASLPPFLSLEDANLIAEAGESVHFLEEHHSDHPALHQGVHDLKSLQLELTTDLKAAEESYAKAQLYQSRLLGALDEVSKAPSRQIPRPLEPDSNAAGEEDIWEQLRVSYDQFDVPLSASAFSTSDPLINKITELTHADSAQSTSPELDLTPVSIPLGLALHSVLVAQSQVLNVSCLRLFFEHHRIRSHFRIQRRFQLFGDGLFTSKLSSSLFDQSLESTERQNGRTRSGFSMSLNLGNRQSWPPASSELRLALMGILAETYRPLDSVRVKGTREASDKLPGDMGFSIRDLPEGDFEKCMDPRSLEALDFLKLEYKPPPPIDRIISQESLSKYDRIFQFFLRVLRLFHVTKELRRASLTRDSAVDTEVNKFTIEAFHFIFTLYGYLTEVAVGLIWQAFEQQLDKAEQQTHRSSDKSALSTTESFKQLRGLHDAVLDQILFNTFLRRRQEQVMSLLEEIFRIILSFAEHVENMSEAGSGGSNREQVQNRYKSFRKRTNMFVTVCKGLSERRSPKDRSGQGLGGQSGLMPGIDNGTDGSNPIGILVLRLDMNGYFTGREM